MTYTVTKLTGEPIVIIKAEPPTDDYFDEDAPVLHAQLDALASQVQGVLYCVMDTRLLDISFSDILLWIDENHQGLPGTASDARLRLVVVGEHPLIPTGLKKVRQKMALDIPHFDTVAVALAYVRSQLNSLAST
ncbi:MAG: hypothetical protein GYB65_19960 [Chloroflexi bacterium]|nr:hypothetical protein [Chloroflexota bacterium]